MDRFTKEERVEFEYMLDEYLDLFNGSLKNFPFDWETLTARDVSVMRAIIKAINAWASIMPAAPAIESPMPATPAIELPMPVPAIEPPMPAPAMIPMPAASAIEPPMPAATAIDLMPAASTMPTPIPEKPSSELFSLATNYVGIRISMDARHARHAKKSWIYKGIDDRRSISRLGIG